MAGYMPPKPPERRARKNKDPRQPTILDFRKGDQPLLPADFEWHPQTIVWWKTWAESAQAETFTDVDWQFLLDTATLHTKFWNGAYYVAGELRQRVDKFGCTPESRAKLRMIFADADEKDAKRGTSTSSAAPGPKTVYGNLRAISTD